FWRPAKSGHEMTFSKCVAAHVFGAGIAAASMVFAPHQVAAQPAADTKHAAKPAPKPVPVQIGSDYWAVNTSLPSQYSAERPRQQSQQHRTASPQRSASQGVQTEITSEFGRIPVQGAAGSTVGVTSGQTSSGRFADGREVPGINANTRSES